VDHVRQVAPRFHERLKAFADHPLVGEVRSVGLIGAAELVADKAAKRPFHPTQAVGAYCSGRAEVHGLIVRAMVDSVAFCPPLIITESEIAEMFKRFAKALDETEMWVTKNGLRNIS